MPSAGALESTDNRFFSRESPMNNDHDISDEELMKHFAYVGALMVGIALVIGFVANSIG